MKITKYTTLMNEDRMAVLVKESDAEYGTSKKLNDPTTVVDMLNTVFNLDKQTEEYVYLIALDASCKPKGVFEVSHGIVNASLLSPREVVQKVLLCNSVNFIIAHNHPSGSVSPSREDKDIYTRLLRCGNLMGTPLIDSIIVGENGNYYSFKEMNEHEEESDEEKRIQKYEGQYFYRVEARDNKKVIHVDGFYYRAGNNLMLVQFCFLYTLPGVRFDESQYKQYSGMLSKAEAFDYTHDAIELAISDVNTNTPEGWYVDYVNSEKGVNA